MVYLRALLVGALLGAHAAAGASLPVSDSAALRASYADGAAGSKVVLAAERDSPRRRAAAAAEAQAAAAAQLPPMRLAPIYPTTTTSAMLDVPTKVPGPAVNVVPQARPWQSEGGPVAYPAPTGTAESPTPASAHTFKAQQTGPAGWQLVSKSGGKASYKLNTGPPGLILKSNNPSYGPGEVRADLVKIMKWAYDDGNLTPDEMDETTAAIMSAAQRYYPDVPTRAMCRIIMADIKAESDFNPRQRSPGRLDSGDALGLMQISLGTDELPLWQQHARVSNNTWSWAFPAAGGDNGILYDWPTGKQMRLGTLQEEDLFRPWLNIHLASWIQSNLARTSSNDPYYWDGILAATKSGNKAATDAALVGTGLSRTPLTGLGSWVAGPASSGPGGYDQVADEISGQYFDAILEGVSVLYGKRMGTDWLDSWTLTAGLVDYR